MNKLLFFLLLLNFNFTYGQLSEDWSGIYSGKMYILAENYKPDSLDLVLTIEEQVQDSVWKFNMKYHSEKYKDIEKDYVLLYSKTKNQYLLDEKNGIIIDVTFLGNTLYEFYEVDNRLYAVSFKKTENGIYFEIYGASSNPSRETLSEADENNVVYNVFSLKPTFVQSAILIKE